MCLLYNGAHAETVFGLHSILGSLPKRIANCCVAWLCSHGQTCLYLLLYIMWRSADPLCRQAAAQVVLRPLSGTTRLGNNKTIYSKTNSPYQRPFGDVYLWLIQLVITTVRGRGMHCTLSLIFVRFALFHFPWNVFFTNVAGLSFLQANPHRIAKKSSARMTNTKRRATFGMSRRRRHSWGPTCGTRHCPTMQTSR